MADDLVIRVSMADVRRFVADADSAGSAVGGIGDRADRTGGRFAALTGRLGVFARTAGVAAAAAGVAFGALLVRATRAASSLGEQINATNVVFGASSAGVQQWAQTTADSIGVSQRAALEAATGFGGLFSTVGLGQEAAATMSQRLVQRSADLASLYNTSTADALEAVRSGLAGETEPLRRYNVFLSEAAINAEAMRAGLWNGTGQITNMARVLATQSLILRQSHVAAGDFARTSESLANAQRRASASFEDLSATVGEVFLPIAAKGYNILNRLLNILRGGTRGALGGGLDGELGERVTAVVEVVKRVTDAIGQRVTAVAGVVRAAWPAVQETLVEGWRLVQAGWESFGEPALRGLGDLLGALVPVVVDGAREIGGVLRGALSEIAPIVQDAVRIAVPVIQDMVTQVVALFRWMAPTVRPILVALAGVIRDVVALIAAIWDRWGDDIMAVVRASFTVVAAIVRPALEVLRSIIQTVTALIRGDWSGVWNGLKGIVTGVIGGILGYLRAAAGLWLAQARALGGAILSGIRSVLGGLAGVVTGAITSAAGTIAGMVGVFLSAAKRLGQAIVDGIVAGLRAAGQAIADVFWGLIPDPIENFLRGGPGARAQAQARFFQDLARQQGPVTAPGSLLAPHALGGWVNTPFALVGERGPELVSLPIGSFVHTAIQTRTLLDTVGASSSWFASRALGGQVLERISLVGERGPELVTMPAGTYTHSVATSEERVVAPAQPQPIVVHVHAVLELDGEVVARKTLRAQAAAGART